MTKKKKEKDKKYNFCCFLNYQYINKKFGDDILLKKYDNEMEEKLNKPIFLGFFKIGDDRSNNAEQNKMGGEKLRLGKQGKP